MVGNSHVNQYTSWSGGILPPSHDANGNALTTYAGATLTWDIHNQLASASKPNGDTAQYQYDALGRRTKRTETIGGVPISTWFLTNGWNVELEYENGAYARRQTWGQDLSQSLQGAGGVGGLVMFEELPPGGGAPVPSFPTYDGNGNITAWVNASGTVTARQRYDAYGNVIEQTGTPPSRYGFSTKPIELVTGFLYYGYRYYDPVTGRWPSRDPIEEEGGINLYAFVGNDGVNWVDIKGLANYATSGYGWSMQYSQGQWQYQQTIYTGKPSRPTTKCALIQAKWLAVIAASAKELADSLDSVFPNYDSMPFQHCVWNCRMVLMHGEAFAEDMSWKKEMADTAWALMGIELVSAGCWDGLSDATKDNIRNNGRSALQPADFRDNATGRECGRFLRDDLGLVRNTVLFKDCECCCADSGVGPNTPEGKGTDRPFGPFAYQIPGANN